MLEKLAAIEDRWKNIGEKLADPDVIRDMKKFRRLNIEYKELGEVVKSYHSYRNILSNIADSKSILENEKDEELREMARMELDELQQARENSEEQIRKLLIPKDPEDARDVMLEIRAGTGGDEAALFAGDLFRMYTRYCENRKWKIEIVSANEGSSGGYKEIVAEVTGSGVFGVLKYESGVHRVQRVPATESGGRIHTSAATVAVLPEAEEVDVNINPADLRIDTYRASGAGGQHVNKTESAVRIVHNPTGITVECQDSRSQLKNRETALKVLRTRIYEVSLQEHLAAIAGRRKTMVSSGDRSAKIRTYNYPQGRVTDHRINLTLYTLEAILNGDIQDLLDSLQIAENAEKMKAGESL